MQKESRKVSMMVVKRLPKYYQYLSDLKRKNIKTISSKELGEMTGLTASQIRQDLNSFGAYGKQGKGYTVNSLLEEIHHILGLGYEYNCVIIGYGNLGRAISKYERFNREGIRITGVFDVDAEVVGTQIGELKVRHLDELERFAAENRIDICILSVPREVGQDVADRICALGIKGILNFVPLDLVVPEHVTVENVNITDSLFTLTYLLNE